MDELLPEDSEVNGALRADSALLKILERTPRAVDLAQIQPAKTPTV